LAVSYEIVTIAPAASASTVRGRGRARTGLGRAARRPLLAGGAGSPATSCSIATGIGRPGRRHEEIEEWDFRGGRSFAVIGRLDDDSNPRSGFGWMCRLVDAGVLQAAAFRRVRKPLLLL
jgi:hypothetical protein